MTETFDGKSGNCFSRWIRFSMHKLFWVQHSVHTSCFSKHHINEAQRTPTGMCLHLSQTVLQNIPKADCDSQKSRNLRLNVFRCAIDSSSLNCTAQKSIYLYMPFPGGGITCQGWCLELLCTIKFRSKDINAHKPSSVYGMYSSTCKNYMKTWRRTRLWNHLFKWFHLKCFYTLKGEVDTKVPKWYYDSETWKSFGRTSQGMYSCPYEN